MLYAKSFIASRTFVFAAALPIVAFAATPSHLGNNDPTTEGFITVVAIAGANVAPVNNDLTHSSWQMAAVSTGTQYSYVGGGFTAAEKQGISTGGFAFSFEARVLQGAATTIYSAASPYLIGSAGIDTGTRRYQILLGLDAVGDTVVVLPSALIVGPQSQIGATGPSFTLVGQGNGYHKYDLLFSPLTQQATLYIDGTLTSSSYTGYNNFIGDTGLGFSVFSGGTAQYSAVNLNISPVPEPATAALTLAGIGLVLLAVTKKNTRTR